MNYTEEKDVTKKYKKCYVDGFNKIIHSRQIEYAERRKKYAADIMKNGEKYREDFKKMLGWPLVDYERKNDISAESELLSAENGYSIYRMSFEVLEGLKITGLFFKHEGDEKLPFAIVQHGGWGTAEHISGIYGSTTNYNDMLHRVFKRKINVFAPSLLLWSDNYGVPFDRTRIDADLKRLGSSVAAVEIFGITRIIDYFEKNLGFSKLGMVGLSYGGFYTLFTAAVDERIAAAISCSFFNTRDVYGWPDWTWNDSAGLFDDAEIAALVYPRRLWIEIGDNDELFNVEYGKSSWKRLKDICIDFGTEWLNFNVFEGKHEFFKDDGTIDEFTKFLHTN